MKVDRERAHAALDLWLDDAEQGGDEAQVFCGGTHETALMLVLTPDPCEISAKKIVEVARRILMDLGGDSIEERTAYSGLGGEAVERRAQQFRKPSGPSMN